VGGPTLALPLSEVVHPEECDCCFRQIAACTTLPASLSGEHHTLWVCVLCLHQLLIMALPCVTAVYLARGHRKSKCYWVYFWTAADHVDGVAAGNAEKNPWNITHAFRRGRRAHTTHIFVPSRGARLRRAKNQNTQITLCAGTTKTSTPTRTEWQRYRSDSDWKKIAFQLWPCVFCYR
jgi:hypothetical protein